MIISATTRQTKGLSVNWPWSPGHQYPSATHSLRIPRFSLAGYPGLNAATSSEDSVSSSEFKEVASQEAWDGYQEDVLPSKLQGKIVRNLRHQILTLYRRLFGFVFVTNFAIVFLLLVRGGINARRLGLITLAHLFVAILMRQDYVINAFFNFFCDALTSREHLKSEYCAFKLKVFNSQLATVNSSHLCSGIISGVSTADVRHQVLYGCFCFVRRQQKR
ncbi:hypothetical protein B0H19DRAFT_404758 [Mycena capillaripes]|nr:hypothetical protein B0H19DRAFT_404758 [Mycena capillaripes]